MKHQVKPETLKKVAVVEITHNDSTVNLLAPLAFC